MSLLETVLAAQGGNLIKNLGKANGIDPQQALSVLGKIVPGLSQNLNQNTDKSGGLEALFGALQKGNHRDYLNDNQRAFSKEGTMDGNNILGHILGSKDASRALASQVSSQTGVGTSIIKKMLPQIATMVMGAMGSQSRSSGSLGGLAGLLGGGQPKQANSLLTTFLDRDRDGSIVDDLMSMAAKQLLK